MNADPREYIDACHARVASQLAAFRSLAVLLAACVTGACTGSAGPRAPEQAAPQTPAIQPLVLLAPEVDLSGTWATGSGPEPASPRITLHPDCTHHPAAWVIKQSNNTIQAWAFTESYDQGIAVRGPGPARVMGSPGTISGLDVSIDDGETRYALRFDKETGHLRGTRNGATFWAVRQVVVRSGACPGVP